MGGGSGETSLRGGGRIVSESTHRHQEQSSTVYGPGVQCHVLASKEKIYIYCFELALQLTIVQAVHFVYIE